MSLKVTYFLLLGAALIIGLAVGRVVAKHSRSRFASLAIYLAGAVGFFVGLVAADTDHRFRLLAIGGLCLQVAGIVSSFRSKRTLKESSADLWSTAARR